MHESLMKIDYDYVRRVKSLPMSKQHALKRCRGIDHSYITRPEILLNFYCTNPATDNITITEKYWCICTLVAANDKISASEGVRIEKAIRDYRMGNPDFDKSVMYKKLKKCMISFDNFSSSKAFCDLVNCVTKETGKVLNGTALLKDLIYCSAASREWAKTIYQFAE